MNDISLTTWIAVYGAALSSILLGWSLYRDLSDRGRLQVYCYIGKIVNRAGTLDDRDYLVYSVTNTGRRPLNVVQVGGRKKAGEHFLVIPRGLPRMLKPGETHTEYGDDLSVLQDGLEFLCAWDSLGKTWKMKRKELKALIEKASGRQNNDEGMTCERA